MKKRLLALIIALAMAWIGLCPAWAEDTVSVDAEAAGEETAFDLSYPEGEAPVESLPIPEVEGIAKAAELVLTCDSATLGVGEKLDLLGDDWTAEALPAFSTSNKKIVSVSQTGEIKALKKGSATVTATLDGQSAACSVRVLKAPTALSIEPASVELGFDAETGRGDSCALVPTLTKDSASAIAYSGYDSGIVTVQDNALVAVGTGTTTVTASTFNGKTASIKVRVLSAPTQVAFDPVMLTVGEGESCKLKVVFNEGSASAMTYESGNPSVATVDETGMLTALRQGTAEITGRTLNGLATTCIVSVVPAPKALYAEPASMTLGVGETSPPIAVSTDLGPGSGRYTFTSSKPKTVSVSADGAVKALKKGSAVITIKNGGGISTTVKVTVKTAPKRLSLNTDRLMLGFDDGVGDEAVLTATLPKNTASAIAYSGYDANVVAVDADGRVKAVGVGETTITASTFNGKTDSVTVIVQPGPQSLSLESEISLGMGENRKLEVTPVGGYCASYEFESSHPEVVEVDDAGRLTAVSAGASTITVRCYNGATASCAVTVTPAPTYVTATPASLTLGVGETAAPIVAATDADGEGKGFTFKSGKVKVATVSADGVVKGLKKGTTSVTVTAYNGVSTSVKVTVKAAPKSITLNKKALNLGVGGQETLSATLSSNSASAIHYTSSDESVATVDEAGEVTARGYGAAVITARTFNGLTATCTVTVMAPAQAISMAESLSAVTATYTDFPIRALDASGNAYEGSFEISFSPEGIAAYEDGKVLGLAAGSTVMTVTSGEVSARCQIKVASYKSVHGVQSIAHRGGSGYWPENTLEAFRNAASKGADGVELDARSTKDGYQVIHHDATFKVGSKKYTVSKLKLSELKNLKPSVPTLDEALETLAATKLAIHLELKETADGAKCVRAIRSHGLEDRTVYFSFYEPQLKQVYSADPNATLGMSLNADAVYNSETLMNKAASLHLSFFVANKALMNQTVTDYWHRHGLKISVWTPNTRSEVKALCELGVDYILSDYPDYCVDYR